MSDTTSERARIATDPQLGRAIRAMRRHHRLTLTQLSERSGLSVAFLSQIENNRANPSLHSLGQIAQALACSANDLLGAGTTDGPIEIGRAPAVFDDGQRSLVPAGEGIAVHEIRCRAGRSSEMRSHPQDCVVYVAHGRIQLVIGATEHYLAGGDSIVVPAGSRYEWTAVDDCTVITARLGDHSIRPRH